MSDRIVYYARRFRHEAEALVAAAEPGKFAVVKIVDPYDPDPSRCLYAAFRAAVLDLNSELAKSDV